MSKSKGQTVLEAIAGWIGGYMSFTDPAYALVCALWAMHTWTFERFDATPYLCITAGTRGAGKTRLMELLAMVSRSGRSFGDMTPASMFRLIETNAGNLTIFFDEAEKLSASAAGVMRSVMNTGYRRGQTILRTIPGPDGGLTKEFSVYSPKCFALIGDVNDTLKDRSIVVRLERGTPAKDFEFATARDEATLLVAMIDSIAGRPIQMVRPDFLAGRDREIWTSMYGVLESLKVDQTTTDQIIAASADMVALKTAPARTYTASVEDEAKAERGLYSERAIVDLASTFKAGEKFVLTADAVVRMKAIPAGPWRTIKGTGLNDLMLADLLRPLGVHPKQAKVPKTRLVRRGYSLENVRASLPKPEGE